MSAPQPILKKNEIFEMIHNAESGVLPRAESEVFRLISTLQTYIGLVSMIEILSRPDAMHPHDEIHELTRQITNP